MERGINYIKLLFALKMGDFFYFLFNLSLSGLPICQVTDRNPGYRYVTQFMASLLIYSFSLTYLAFKNILKYKIKDIKAVADLRNDMDQLKRWNNVYLHL